MTEKYGYVRKDSDYSSFAEDCQLCYIGVMHEMLQNLLKDLDTFIMCFEKKYGYL